MCWETCTVVIDTDTMVYTYEYIHIMHTYIYIYYSYSKHWILIALSQMDLLVRLCSNLSAGSLFTYMCVHVHICVYVCAFS